MKMKVGDDVTISVIDIPAVIWAIAQTDGSTKESSKQPAQAVAKVAPSSHAAVRQEGAKSAACCIL